MAEFQRPLLNLRPLFPKFESPPEWKELAAKLRAAERDPKHRAAAAWQALRDAPLGWQALALAKWLPDPRRRRGRPKGTTLHSEVAEALKRIEATGEKPTTAARKVANTRNDAKNRADYLKKLLPKSGKK
jgi:hypothetical protein